MSNPVKVDEPVKEPIKEPTQEPTKEPKEPSEPVRENKEPKEPKEPATDYSKEVENLRAEIVTLTEKAGKVETVSKENETLKKDIEELITKLVETKLGQVPEEYKELIPDNLDLTQKLNWLDKAEAKGLFNKVEKKKPNVEIGKPMNIEPENVDTTKLTGSQLLKLAYNTIKK